MTTDELIQQPIDVIVRHPFLISATTENRGDSMYWCITFSAERKQDGYYFMGKKVSHSNVRLYKLIEL